MKRVIVTGGSRGIGAAIVKRFAKAGNKVCFIYKSNDEAAKELVSENVYCVKADVSNPGDAERGIREAIDMLGGADVLVNNAGIAQIKPFGDITNEDFSNLINTDLGGCFYCSKAVLSEFLKAHKGVIVNVASMWGEVGASCEVHYSAAKAGVIGFTKALAKELALSGIRVNCVSPGFIATEMNRKIDEEVIAAFAEEIPMQRLGSAEEVAAAVDFLCSEDASYITGQVLSVNGGYVV